MFSWFFHDNRVRDNASNGIINKGLNRMKKKYIKRSGNIDADYQYYLGKEGIYGVLFGHKPEGYKKSDYIWKRLLIEYGYEVDNFTTNKIREINNKYREG